MSKKGRKNLNWLSCTKLECLIGFSLCYLRSEYRGKSKIMEYVRALMHLMNSDLYILSLKSQWDFKRRCAKDFVNVKFKRDIGTLDKIVWVISIQIVVFRRTLMKPTKRAWRKKDLWIEDRGKVAHKENWERIERGRRKPGAPSIGEAKAKERTKGNWELIVPM